MFFILLIVAMASSGSMTLDSLANALIRALFGASAFWVIGIVIADIFLKGVVTEVDVDRKCLVDGGVLQQLHTAKERAAPGGNDMPFVKIERQKKKEESAKKPRR
jgi:hypothetical protein